MDAATQAYLFELGDPYAKLSVLEQGDPESAESGRKIVHLDEATRAYLFNLGDPYAKLSVLEQDDRDMMPVTAPGWGDLLWKSKTQVYQFVAESFAVQQLRTNPPPLLKQLRRGRRAAR